MVDVTLSAWLHQLRRSGVLQVSLTLDPAPEAHVVSSRPPAPQAPPAQASALPPPPPPSTDEIEPLEGEGGEDGDQDDPLFWGTSLRPRRVTSGEASDG